MGIHRHVLWDVEPSDAPKITAVTWDRASDIIGELYTRMESGPSVRIAVHVPNALVNDGKHGVADGDRPSDGELAFVTDGLVKLGVDAARAFALHQSEKRPAACACYMGAGAKPYAHEPSCPVHPRYADTQLLEFNGEVQEFYTSLLDGSKCDGKRANLEAEYLGALASLKARGAANGALYRIHELGKSLGRSVHGVCADFNR